MFDRLPINERRFHLQIERRARQERGSTAAHRNVFIYLPERFNEHSQVVNQFPGGDLQTFSGTFADPLFYAYAVDSE